jgi:hypothetical protein
VILFWFFSFKNYFMKLFLKTFFLRQTILYEIVLELKHIPNTLSEPDVHDNVHSIDTYPIVALSFFAASLTNLSLFGWTL